MKLFYLGLFVFILLFSSCEENKTLLFAGSYTNKVPGDGIKVFEIDTRSGDMKMLFVLEGITNPSFIRLSDDGRILFTISHSQQETNGFLSSYRVNSKTGALTLISKESTLGRNPVHIELSQNQDLIAVSNYTDPSLSFYMVNTEGEFGPALQHLSFQDSSIVSGRQDQAHLHSASFSGDGNFLYAHDLGSDKIRTFLVEDTLNDLAVEDILVDAGAGPRHFTFDEAGVFAYLLCELSGSIHAYSVDQSSGQFELIKQYATYGQEQDVYRAADIHFGPGGRYLYASNRGPEENTIVSFAKKEDGSLEYLQRMESGGEHPRNFAISQDGHLIIIANQFSNKLVIRDLDPKSGMIGEVVNEIDFPGVSTVQIHEY